MGTLRAKFLGDALGNHHTKESLSLEELMDQGH